MAENVEELLNQIRPHLQADGGDVEFVDFSEGVLKVRLTGACQGCPMSMMTLQQGIGRYLRERLPDVKEVVAV